MIGIKQIGTALGSIKTINTRKFPGQFDQQFFEQNVGILETFHKKPGETATDLCVAAIENLQATYEFDVQQIDALFLVSQHTLPNIPPLSTRVHGALNCSDRVYCLDLSIGCTGFTQGLHVATSLMKGNQWKTALLFNVETLSDVLNPLDPNTNFIFSDAASVCVLSADQPFLIPMQFNFETSGRLCSALEVNQNGLDMKGQEIYSFVSRKVPLSITKLIQQNSLSVADIAMFFFHQASLRTVNKIVSTFLPEVIEAPFDIRDYGNTASCSLPFLFKRYHEEILKKPRKYFVASSFGSGLSLANVLLKKGV